MTTIAEFLDANPNPLRRRLDSAGAHLDLSDDLFLVQSFWKEHGAGILAGLETEYQRLRAGRAALAAEIRDRWTFVRKGFTEGGLDTLKRAMKKHGGVDPRASVYLKDGRLLGCGRSLDLFREEGGARLFSARRRLRTHSEAWANEKVEILVSFADDPMVLPAWRGIGGPPDECTPRHFQMKRRYGLWDTSAAPWVTNRDGFGKEYCTGADPGIGQYELNGVTQFDHFPPCTADVIRFVLNDEWELQLEAHLPIDQISMWHREEAESPGVAALVLDLLFGGTVDGEPWADGGPDHPAVSWIGAMERPFVRWRDSGELADGAKISPYPDEQASMAFEKFRRTACSMSSGDALSFAAVARFCLERLAPPGELATPSDPAGGGIEMAKDGAWLRVQDKTYKFKKGNQARAALALYRVWIDSGGTDGCGMGGESLSEEVGSSGCRFSVRDTFAGNEALGTIIRSPSKGVFAFYLAEQPSPK